jgi:hypothetical protein
LKIIEACEMLPEDVRRRICRIVEGEWKGPQA